MKRLIFILLLFPVVFSAFARQESADVRAGNKRYEEGRFTEAEIEYRKGLQKNSDSFEANFNLGNALFRQEKYEDAVKYYANAAARTPGDKQKLAAAYHNIGNSLLVNEKVAESIEAYKMALKNNPADNDTRYNLAFAQELLKQQQQQQQQNQDENKQNEQDKQNQDKQNQQNQQDQQNQDRQDKHEQQQEQSDQQQDDRQQPQPQEPQLSKENAQQILDALLEDEKDTQEKVKKQKARGGRKVEKDW